MISRKLYKNTTNKSRWNPKKKCSSNPQGGKKRQTEEQETEKNKMIKWSNISTITLNINGLSTPIKSRDGHSG